MIRKLYQWIVSPTLHFLAGPGMGCRFSPTCSEIFFQSREKHGLWRAFRLFSAQFMKCHPFSHS